MFEPTRFAAEHALYDFLPRAGKTYATKRNFDYGKDARSNVSQLSPWIRLRVLPEWTVIDAVLQEHGRCDAAKFIDEVCWRTYWKGSLQLRPTLWENYLAELETAQKNYIQDITYLSVLRGQSGIKCLDVWTEELIETGYLHNHARMWYASIWTHTLKLPWVLGAALFLKHLLDGDAASNTLGWRWVAGLHTPGKTYLATAQNIEKYTDGRFSPDTPLAKEPVLDEAYAQRPAAGKLSPLDDQPVHGRSGLLIHEEDLSAIHWLADKCKPAAIAGFFPQQSYTTHGIAQTVIDFRKACMREQLPEPTTLHTDIETIVNWARTLKLKTLILAEPPVGLWNPVLPELKKALTAAAIDLALHRHWWDAHFHPHARAGFFRFKKAIPFALDQISRS